MKTKLPVFIIVVFTAASTNADVYKCKSRAGEMIYQPQPCQAAETPKGKVNIKPMTPQQQATANSELKAEEQEEATYDQQKAKEEKQQENELQSQEQLELQERRTNAEEIQADTERKRVLGGPGSPYWRPAERGSFE